MQADGMRFAEQVLGVRRLAGASRRVPDARQCVGDGTVLASMSSLINGRPC